MINWGVPDWHNDSYYPNDLTTDQWRWEFLRRNKDYREDWLLHFFSSYQYNLKAYKNVPIDEGIESWEQHFSSTAEMPCSRDKYGINYLLDPSQPSSEINLFAAQSGFLVTHALPDQLAQFSQDNIKLLAIDLKQPLPEQFKKAKIFLTKIQEEIIDKVPSQRKHTDKWPLYLRILDAHDSGDTWAEIGNVILAGRCLEDFAVRAYQYYTQARNIQNQFLSG